MLRTLQYILLKEFGTNTWLLYDDESSDAILIDPSAPSEKLLVEIQNLNLRVHTILITHGHGDHIGGCNFFKQALSAKLAIHADDAVMLIDNKKNLSTYMDMPLDNVPADIILQQDDTLALGKYQFTIIHTPGHTKGGICLYGEKHLFSGDTLFEQSIGRTDLPGGNYELLISAIKNKLFTLADDTIVFPGHGPKTTIGIEKSINPFLR